MVFESVKFFLLLFEACNKSNTEEYIDYLSSKPITI